MARSARISMLATKLGVVVLIVGLLGSPVPSAAFSYSESVSGDLDSFGLPVGTVFPFTVGANTVSGTFSNNGPQNTVDTDSFAFSVPAGSKLQSVSFAFSTSGDPTGGHTEFALCPANAGCNIFNELASEFVQFDFATSPISAFGSDQTLLPGFPSVVNSQFP